ncbi:MAG: biotin--[acetyl-CoA-carboxylase] ligase [Chitinophagaceae bacterium]|nr:MAG: biotin--[acetyl-CoA-carboxylase] ligase [Chitinophagaceae bacterium]
MKWNSFVKNKYKLPPASKHIGAAIVELQQVDSTNNYATGLAHAGLAEHGTAVLAWEQTTGKGQRNKGWIAEPGANITMSLAFRPPEVFGADVIGLSPADGFRFSMAVALGAQRFFAHYAGEETFVKWPNDLYWRDRKAGGILIENILAGNEWKWAIVGLGININQTGFGELARQAVSLRQITGREWEVKALALTLRVFIADALEQLAERPSSISADYHNVLYKRGASARFRRGGRVFTAEVVGVTPEGLLRLHHGMEEQFAVGEVEWVPVGDHPIPRDGA